MDKLSKDATAALKAGMSYGKYMAMKNPTKITPPEPKGVRHVCGYCGKEFYRQDNKVQKFCCERCRESFYHENNYVSKQRDAKTCTICGKQFIPRASGQKYCGKFCANVAKVEKIKTYYERRKKGGESNTEAMAK